MMEDATTLLDYMINRLNNILNNLVVFKDKMLENIYLTNGVIFSGSVLNYLVSKGYSREKAYDLIQPLTFKSFNEKVPFRNLLIENNVLTNDECDEIFKLDRYLKNVDAIYKSVGIN